MPFPIAAHDLGGHLLDDEGFVLRGRRFLCGGDGAQGLMLDWRSGSTPRLPFPRRDPTGALNIWTYSAPIPKLSYPNWLESDGTTSFEDGARHCVRGVPWSCPRHCHQERDRWHHYWHRRRGRDCWLRRSSIPVASARPAAPYPPRNMARWLSFSPYVRRRRARHRDRRSARFGPRNQSIVAVNACIESA